MINGLCFLSDKRVARYITVFIKNKEIRIGFIFGVCHRKFGFSKFISGVTQFNILNFKIAWKKIYA